MHSDEEILPIRGDEKIIREPILIHRKRIFKRMNFGRELDMFHYLMRYRKILNRVFGDETFLIPVEKVIGVNSKFITDGLLVKVGDRRIEIWIVEMEMLRHGVKSHIKDQLSKIADAMKEINSWSLAANIYSELRRDRYRFNKIREMVLGSRKASDDLIPEIKKAVDSAAKNILLIIDRVNLELLEAIEEIRRNRVNVEVVVLQRYVDIDEEGHDMEGEILLITPMKGSEVDKRKVSVKSYTKRRMDRYWNGILKAVRSLGWEVKRREYRKTRYYLVYKNDNVMMIMRKMRKKGGVEMWIDSKLLTGEVIKQFNIPEKKVLTRRGKMFKRLLENSLWDTAYRITSHEVPYNQLIELLKRISVGVNPPEET